MREISRKVEVRYPTMVSDSDSKAHNRLLQEEPYGPEITVEKEDCLNHVGKQLVVDFSKRGETLGERGHGRFTSETIRELHVYYSTAI